MNARYGKRTLSNVSAHGSGVRGRVGEQGLLIPLAALQRSVDKSGILRLDSSNVQYTGTL